jgi:hypothetical protein
MIARKSMEDVASGNGELFFGFDCALHYIVGRLPSNVVVRRAEWDFSGWLLWLRSMRQLGLAGMSSYRMRSICSPA